MEGEENLKLLNLVLIIFQQSSIINYDSAVKIIYKTEAVWHSKQKCAVAE